MSQIYGPSAGGNVFTIMQPDSGTSPTADSSTDTLTFTGANGITVVGDSTTDTLTIKLVEIDQIDFLLMTGANDTYCVRFKAKRPFTINSANYETSSGTISLAVKINSTDVTSLSALSLSSTPGSANASGANSVAVDDSVNFVFSSNSSATKVKVSLKITYTG